MVLWVSALWFQEFEDGFSEFTLRVSRLVEFVAAVIVVQAAQHSETRPSSSHCPQKQYGPSACDAVTEYGGDDKG